MLAALLAYGIWQDIKFTRKEQAISQMLKEYDGFRGLSVEVSKPGFHRISGTVKSTNDFARLKDALHTARIRKVIVLVDVDDRTQ